MRRIYLLAFAAILAGGAVAASAQTPSNPDEVIAQRQARYKKMGDEFGAMKKGIDSGADVAQFAAAAADMADWGRKAPASFPVGTETGHNTHATAAVWSDRATFEKNSADLATESDKLAQLASANDKAGFAAQWQKTGGTCGACHANQKFRTRL